MNELTYHEIANIFPLMQENELRKLSEDIRATGLQNKIILYEGKILDGRNRYEACGLAGVAPEYGEYVGADPLAYVISLNLHRRHLSESQRAVVASRLANMRSGERTDLEPNANLQKVISQPEAAKMLNVSTRMVASVKAIEKAAPEKIKDIESGKTTVHQAEKEIKQKEKEADKAAEVQSLEIKPVLYCADAFSFDPGPVDLLLTDPPYSTDVENIREFAPRVIGLLGYVKSTGRAYIFVGSYPDELTAYLTAPSPRNMKLSQILVWTYRNTLGPSPKQLYKNNWQAILYFVGNEAPPLDCPVLNELFSVQDINAPDGRLGDRYHAWQKPLEISDRFIRHSTKPGDTVYDPFSCTGTFLISASKLGRHAIGCEISQEAIAIANSRGVQCATI